MNFCVHVNVTSRIRPSYPSCVSMYVYFLFFFLLLQKYRYVPVFTYLLVIVSEIKMVCLNRGLVISVAMVVVPDETQKKINEFCSKP